MTGYASRLTSTRSGGMVLVALVTSDRLPVLEDLPPVSRARPHVIGGEQMTYPSGSADLPAFLTTKELAEMTRSPESTVRYWRHTGRGPRGTRVGKRRG